MRGRVYRKGAGCALSSSTSTAHFGAGQQLTPATQYGKADCKEESNGIGSGCTPAIMEGDIVPLAQAHDADPRHVDRNDRSAGKKTPQVVLPRWPVIHPLADSDPAQKRQRHVRERGTGREDYHVA